MTWKGGKIFNNNIGQSSIEFVIVMPVLIIVILTVSQFGILVYVQNILEQSSREGVRVISTTNSNSMAYEAIQNLCGNLDRNNMEIEINPSSKDSRKVGTMVSIHIAYKYGGISDIIKLIMGKELRLKSQSSMRMECN
ncbi:MAG: pilus assembly protein [Candidatus Humimicrobiaceae bacterium]